MLHESGRLVDTSLVAQSPWNESADRSVLDPYRDSAAVIEASDLDFTILRPGWFTPDEAVAYQITQKGEPFKGHEVSLNSVSDLIVKLALTAGMEIRRSLGVSRG